MTKGCLIFQNVTFLYDRSPSPIFDQLTVRFGTGWTGIIGPNGSGKTTNHLDLPSIECLEKALEEFPAGLLFVSHDLRFLQHLARIWWEISMDATGTSELEMHQTINLSSET